MAKISESEPRPVLGIDLGTTYCCVGLYKNGQVTIVRNSMGQTTTPSYVAFFESDHLQDELTVGQQAKDEANINPENTIFDAKRLIGRKFQDKIVQEDMKLWPFTVIPDPGPGPEPNPNPNPKIKVNGAAYFPEEISGKLLSFLRQEAEEFAGDIQITDAVITVPAYFNNGQRQATKDAGKLAGLNVLQILNEPTAAAITYSLHLAQPSGSKKNVLIFDLGGGTFDVSVLTVQNGTVKILAVGGDTHLGGEDFDSLMVEHCIKEFFRREGVDLTDGKDSPILSVRFKVNKRLRRLRNECEKQKVFLSSSKKVKVALDTIDGHRDLLVEFSRERFEELIQSKLDQCISTVDQVIKEIPNFTKEDVQDVVLVGGSTHIPKIQQMLRGYFGGKTLSKAISPDEAVAWGAAILANLLRNETGTGSKLNHSVEISDVTSLSLGIQIHEGDFSKIVPKNTTIPFEITKRYSTRTDYQSKVTIKVFEGEDEHTKNNHFLGEFHLSNIPLAPSRQEKCYVTMKINCEGILSVEASSVSNRQIQEGIKISMISSKSQHV